MRIGHQPYGINEIEAAVRVLRSGNLTYGKETAAFEEEWAAWLGVPYAVMVNSGSSANLLALAALKHEGILRDGDEVIVPAVAWSTSLFPIAQVGCVPVLVDVDAETLSLDTNIATLIGNSILRFCPMDATCACGKWTCERAKPIKKVGSRVRAAMAVHLLGNPCQARGLPSMAIVEDCCEAHGAEINGRKVGTFGVYSTFSFFYAHHITCIEGGIVCCHTPERRDLLLSLRSHGWVRERSDRDLWAAEYPDIDPRWLFATPGYNLRPTDVQAAFAREQLKRLDGYVERRVAIRLKMLDMLTPYSEYFGFQRSLPGHKHSGFGFALICKPPIQRKQFQAYLESNGIETRPIVGGNLARQPCMKHIPHRIHGELTNADNVHFNGLMVASHQDVTDEDCERLTACIHEYIGRL